MMARQAAKFGGGLAFNPEDAIDLWEQVRRAVELHEGFAAEAESRAGRWNAFHNASNLVAAISEILTHKPAVLGNGAGPGSRANSPIELAA